MTQDVGARWQFATTGIRHIWETSNLKDRDSLAQRLDDLRRHLTGEMAPVSAANEQENLGIRDRIKDFDIEQSEPYKAFEERGLSGVKLPILVTLAGVLAGDAGITMDREAKRRKLVLFKWLADNWAVLAPHLAHVTLCHDGLTPEGDPIPSD
jgi:hypothetical protein